MSLRQGQLRNSFLTQAQGREVEMSGQPHSLTALFPGKNIPHWPLDVGPIALLKCTAIKVQKDVFYIFIF